MALRDRFKKFFGNDEETEGVGSGNHNNYYALTEEDRAKGDEVKRINREIKKRKALRESYIDKLLDDKEIAIIKNDIEAVGSDKENSDVDNVMMDTISKLLLNGSGVTIPGISPTGHSNSMSQEDFYSDEIVKEANEGIEMPVDVEPSRFTDEEITKNIPKLLNPTQLNYLAQLTEGELLQVHDVIKNKKPL